MLNPFITKGYIEGVLLDKDKFNIIAKMINKIEFKKLLDCKLLKLIKLI